MSNNDSRNKKGASQRRKPMIKIGRNDPCPCGSGKKYKKCCLGKNESDLKNMEKARLVEDFKQYLSGFWSYEEAKLLSTEEIIQKLDGMGIPFDKEVFLAGTEKFISAAELSESWYEHFNVSAKGRDEDFPYYAALILWERLTPDSNMPREKMSNLIDEGFDHLADNDPVKACDVWLKVWAGIKHRWKPEYRSMDPLDNQYKDSFFVSNFCQDLETELHNAGMKDSSYFHKRIDYCREFCRYFPDERELIAHNMKRAIAESFACLGDYEQADRECYNLVAEYPDNPWGYIQWGDLYFFEPVKDFVRAKGYYEKAKAVAQDKEDILAVEERLIDLNRMIPT